MEEGSASLVAAHLAKAERQAGEGGFQLPQRLVCAQEARPKVIDISGGEVHLVVPTDDEPYTLLDQTFRDIRGAHFVGKGDKELVRNAHCHLFLVISDVVHLTLPSACTPTSQVQQMLAELEWIMKSAVERTLANQAQDSVRASLTVDPRILRAQRRSVGRGAAAEEGDSVELISRGGLCIVRSARKESASVPSSGRVEECSHEDVRV